MLAQPGECRWFLGASSVPASNGSTGAGRAVGLEGWLTHRLDGDRELASGLDDSEREPTLDHIKQELPAKPLSPAIKQRGTMRRIAALDVPADQLFQIGDVRHDRSRDLVLCAALCQRRGEQGW